jgi:Na+-translocating ferredoxin:NAD+ oxidoreductase RnfD subunit
VTTASPSATAAPLHWRQLAVGKSRITVVLPSRRDPRLKLSAVIVSLQVLGQTVLGFKVTIAQILVTVAVCAIIDMAVTLGRERILAWPASGLLTGNSIAFILRASGTRHGDWWSLHGIQYFLAAAVVALASKHLIRPGGRHIFNPSNVGLIWVLLVIGPVRVFPQYLWWGPIGAPVVAALVVIALGAVWVLRAVRMVPMALSFLGPFAALIAIFAASGQSFLATWHDGPVEGASYWLNICASPELLIFVFFMMSDPKTAPRGPVARLIFGATTAVVAGALVVFQPTEFGVKVAILASLTVGCALVPLIEALGRRIQGAEPLSLWTRLPGTARTSALLATAIIAAGAVVDTAVLAHNKDVTYIERGLTGARNPQ